MKKILFCLTMVASSLLFSCNEELEIATSADELTPTISEFSPATGPVGTEIIITGENLQKIDKAYINDKEVKIKSRVSGSYMTIETTATANSGVIKLETATKKSATSTATFTYTYPVPTLGTVPPSLEAGQEVAITGENMNVVTKLLLIPSTNSRTTAIVAEIIFQNSTELVFIVPVIASGNFKLQMNYLKESGDGSIQSSVVNLVNDGIIVNEPLTDTYAVGSTVKVTGSGFLTVTKILVNDLEHVPTSFTPTSLEFVIADNPKLADGVHQTTLTFVAGEKSTEIKADFKVEMPTFYKWAQKETGARSTASNIFCIETGDSYSIAKPSATNPVDGNITFTELIDPLAMSKDGGVCSDANQLDPSITDDQYYSVKPYMFMLYYGSGNYLYGPSHTNARLGQNTNNIGVRYGTPNVQFRTLDVGNAAEKAIFDKITSGTLTSADFTPDLIDTFSLTGVGSDEWSNEITGGPRAFATDKTIPRPWGGSLLTSATAKLDYDPNTVILVLYMKPNRGDWDDVELNKSAVRKFGFIDITRLNQVGGHASTLYFNVYWQRTAM